MPQQTVGNHKGVRFNKRFLYADGRNLIEIYYELLMNTNQSSVVSREVYFTSSTEDNIEHVEALMQTL